MESVEKKNINLLKFRKYRSALFPASILSITVILWLFAKQELGWPSSPILAATQISALLAITFLSLQYFIATRSRLVEKIFDGLDVAYLAHHNMGGMAFILMLTHPALLILNAFPATELMRLYILPSYTISYSSGIMALHLYTILLVITYYVRLPYHIWKATHRFMTLPMVFVVIHVLQISSDIAYYMPLRYWILSLAFFGLGCALYKSFFYKHLITKYRYTVSLLNDLGDIMEIHLKPLKKGIYPQPGQFVFLHFTRSMMSREEHPFSISSVSEEGTLRISMKRSGDYTKSIINAKVNDEVTVIGPYGKFGENLLIDDKEMIWIAGGIGITPFLTMLEDEIKRGSTRKISLYYSITDESESNYIEYLQKLSEGMDNIKIIPHISSTEGRLNVESIVNDLGLESLKDRLRRVKVFICGPRSMMDQFTSDFVRKGISPWNIIKEDFNLKSTGK